MEKKFDIKIFVLFLPKVFLKCVLNNMMVICWWNIIVQNGNAKTSDGKSGCVQNINFSLLRSNLSPFTWSEIVDCEVAEWFLQSYSSLCLIKIDVL